MTPFAANARILVVDDEAPVLVTIKAILEQEGYFVDAASSGASALQMVQERHYDLVLTDLKMPGIDGMAVLAAVRKLSPETVTVMMTGFGSLTSALEAVQHGAYEYLLKPTEVAELKQVVLRSLERKRFSEIEVLYRLTHTLPESIGHPESIAAQVCEAARQVLGVHHAEIMWLDSAAMLQPESADSILSDLMLEAALRMRLNAGEIIGVVNAGEGLRAELELKRIHSFLLVPGIGKSGLRCVLWTHNGEHAFEFHASAQRFLRSLVSQATVTLENSALMQELQQNNAQLSAANRKLAELDRLKSQFLSVATHELRTPLTILLGYNSMLAESLADRLSSEERDTLEESIAACKRLIRLVNSMLDLSQIQTGKMPLEIRDIDLRSLVSSVLTLFHHEAKARDISLSSALPARLPRLAADPERLQQVLINLLGNAMKFTRAGGAIKVQARHLSAEDAIEISVSDTGVGISKEDQEHIFDEFSHPHHQAIDGSGDGAGLGLSIVRRVVEAHGGEIRLRSQPGKGSTFSVRLPLGRGSHIAVSA